MREELQLQFINKEKSDLYSVAVFKHIFSLSVSFLHQAPDVHH